MSFDLVIWAIYDHPTDYPHGYVARRWVGEIPSDDMLISPYLDSIENQLREWGLTPMSRMDEDDPTIISVWL